MHRGKRDLQKTINHSPSLDWITFQHILSKFDTGGIDMSNETHLTRIDALVFLGSRALQGRKEASSLEQPEFHELMQRLCLISAQCPAPRLRYQAHLLTTTFLKETAEEQTRLRYICDTLQHCPFEALKVSAVGWLKDELLGAGSELEDMTALQESGAKERLTLLVESLDSVFPFLFPRIDLDQDFSFLLPQLSLFVTALNLLYLLNRSEVLRNSLQVEILCKKHEVLSKFVDPLWTFWQSNEADEGTRPLFELEGIQRMDLIVLGDVLDRTRVVLHEGSP